MLSKTKMAGDNKLVTGEKLYLDALQRNNVMSTSTSLGLTVKVPMTTVATQTTLR